MNKNSDFIFKGHMSIGSKDDVYRSMCRISEEAYSDAFDTYIEFSDGIGAADDSPMRGTLFIWYPEEGNYYMKDWYDDINKGKTTFNQKIWVLTDEMEVYDDYTEETFVESIVDLIKSFNITSNVEVKLNKEIHPKGANPELPIICFDLPLNPSKSELKDMESLFKEVIRMSHK